jgi:carboxyl-terminal processing protease
MKTLTLVMTLVLLSAFEAGGQPASKPEQSFETFWKEFDNHYALFEVKGISWKDMYTRYRSQVTAKTSDAELISIFKEMLDPLQDGHINIFQKDKRLYKGESKNNIFRTEFQGLEKEFWSTVTDLLQNHRFPAPEPRGALVDGNFTKAVPAMYVSRNTEIGYIRFTRFFNQLKGVMGSDKDEQEDRTALSDLVDQTLREFETCKGLIIDLRDNGGGHSGYELAGKFIDRPALVNYKSTRLNGLFSPLEEYHVNPASGIRFTKPLVVLTSDRTASAAEDFALALSRFSHVTLVGTRTRGMFSDIYSFVLPNKIEVSLSNQLYYDIGKTILEDKGVQPAIEIANTRLDLSSKTDRVLIKALEILKQ